MLTMTLALILAQETPSADEWVRKLGSEEYDEREKATEGLRKLGKGAEEALKKAQDSEDAEVRARAKALLDELAGKGKAQARRPSPRPPFQGPFGQGFKGSSVNVQSVNGDSTYLITPGDGSSAITFRKEAAGPVRLDYTDEAGKAQSAAATGLDAFLKDHPALAARYGISENGIDYAGSRVGFKGAAPNAFGPGNFRFNFGRRGPWPFEEEPEKPAADFEPASDALRAQLSLPEGQGVVVARDGAAPGLRRHDVLLEADGKPVGTVADARKAGSAASFTVLRRGKRETLQAAPRKDF